MPGIEPGSNTKSLDWLKQCQCSHCITLLMRYSLSLCVLYDWVSEFITVSLRFDLYLLWSFFSQNAQIVVIVRFIVVFDVNLSGSDHEVFFKFHYRLVFNGWHEFFINHIEVTSEWNVLSQHQRLLKFLQLRFNLLCYQLSFLR